MARVSMNATGGRELQSFNRPHVSVYPRRVAFHLLAALGEAATRQLGAN